MLIYHQLSRLMRKLEFKPNQHLFIVRAFHVTIATALKISSFDTKGDENIVFDVYPQVTRPCMVYQENNFYFTTHSVSITKMHF